MRVALQTIVVSFLYKM